MTFYRGEWCPYCHLALRAYQQALPQMQAGGLPGGDFPADAGPQQGFGGKDGTDLCGLER